MEKIEIRWAKPVEWEDAMSMVWRTFLRFEAKEYDEEGVGHFFEFITDERIYQSFIKGRYLMMLALAGERIVGVATVRSGNRLSLLFVEEPYQRQGIGGALIEQFIRYLQEIGERSMSVTAAPSAREFYQKQGFCLLGPEENHGGVRVYPMEKFFEKAGKRGARKRRKILPCRMEGKEEIE